MAQILLSNATGTGAGEAWRPRDTSAVATYTQHSFQAVGSTSASTGAATNSLKIVDSAGTAYYIMLTTTNS